MTEPTPKAEISTGTFRTALPGVPIETPYTGEAPANGGWQELSVSVVPLLEQARDHIGEKVIVWIAGGIQVDGKLITVDDDTLVLTVDDRTHRYYIAIESVAVLAVER